MAYKRKYKKGEVITSLDELAKCNFAYVCDKIYCRGWFMSWQFSMAKGYIDRGIVFKAVVNDGT